MQDKKRAPPLVRGDLQRTRLRKLRASGAQFCVVGLSRSDRRRESRFYTIRRLPAHLKLAFADTRTLRRPDGSDVPRIRHPRQPESNSRLATGVRCNRFPPDRFGKSIHIEKLSKRVI